MRKKVIGAILGVLSVAGVVIAGTGFTHKPAAGTYPVLLQVVSCEGTVQDGFTVTLKNCHGFTYTVEWESGDCDTGDFYTCIMDDMGTAAIYDDVVIDAKYERPDLFEEVDW